MRISKAWSGPFLNRLYLKDEEIESIATNELRDVGLLPTEPSPIRVDRFIEKRFDIVPQFRGASARSAWIHKVWPCGPDRGCS